MNFKNRELELTKNDLFKKGIRKDTLHTVLQESEFINREILLTTITPTLSDELDRAIRFWNDIDEVEGGERRPIKIFIDCVGGGSLSAMFTLIDSIKISKTPVYTINIGAVYKEALYVYLAGHKRYAYPRSSFMFKKDLKPFDVDDNPQSNFANFCKKQTDEMKDMLFEKTKITESEYEKRETWWIDAEKANDLNICNEVSRTRTMDNF